MLLQIVIISIGHILVVLFQNSADGARITTHYRSFMANKEDVENEI